MEGIGQKEPPGSASAASSSSGAPSASSLPYCGDLDAARRARDSHAVRLLTQLRDQSSLSPLSSPSSLGIAAPPAASHSPPLAPSPSIASSLAHRMRGLDMAHGATGGRDGAGAPQPAGVGLPLSPPPPIIPRHIVHASARLPAFFASDPTSPMAGGKVGRITTVTGAAFVASSPGSFGPTGAGDTDGASPGRVEILAAASAASAITIQQRRPFFGYAQHTEAAAALVAAATRQQHQHQAEEGDEHGGYSWGIGVGEGKHAASASAPSSSSSSLSHPSLCCCPPSTGCAHHHAVVAAKNEGVREWPWTIPVGSWRSGCMQPPSAAGEAPDAAGEAPSEPEAEATIEDPVLMARVPLSQSYLVECPCGHRFGLETLYGCVKVALGDDLIPACPLANHPERAQRCNYLLSQKEVEHVLNRYMPVSRFSSEERRLWRFRRGRLVDGCLGWVSERVSEAFLRKGKIAAGCMECPNGRCGYWVEPTRPREKQRVDCPKCLTAFCTLCKRPYHYRCSCDEVMTITRQWLEWQQHGREPYLMKMAAEDSSYQAALDTFNNRREAHVQEVYTAEQNWALLVADENYKSSRCRRCPHCHRVIERIDGCDTMICGQNAHGGNIQNGCGQGFNWSEAHFYFADIGEKRSIKPFEEVPPPEIARVTHQIMDGAPIKCDICQAHIQGPLAMCINCPTFNCCIRCQNKHTRGHILRLYMDNSYNDAGQEEQGDKQQQQQQQQPCATSPV